MILLHITDRYDLTNATWEILLMLLGAFILGYLLRMFLTNKYKRRVGELETDIARYQRQIGDLTRENDELKAKLKAAGGSDSELKDLRAKIAGYETKISDFQRANNTLVGRLEDCEGKLKTAGAGALGVAAGGGTAESDNKIKELETDITRYQRQIGDLKRENEDLKKRTGSLEMSLRDCEGKLKNSTAGSGIVAGAGSTGSKKDDLKKVEGIGPKIEGLLNDDGIMTFMQLCESPVSRIQKVLDAAGPRYRMHDPGTWPKQARLAAEGKWDELDKLQDELKGGK